MFLVLFHYFQVLQKTTLRNYFQKILQFKNLATNYDVGIGF